MIDEIKIVCFNPVNSTRWVADVYDGNNKRVFCGFGKYGYLKSDAVKEASEWINVDYVKILLFKEHKDNK